MRATPVTARLFVATAICTLSAPTLAQDYGLQSTDSTPISNPSGTTLQGAKTGVLSTGSELNLDNAGTIRGDGTAVTGRIADAGVLVTGGPATITNTGSITGAGFGITTGIFSDPDTNAPSGRAIGSTIINSGTIIGDGNDGIRLMGGGTVTNSGYIAGRVGAGADGISMFSFFDQDLNSFTVIGTVNNLAGGTIEGNRFGVILSNGGIVNNAGTISGNSGSVLMQAGAVGIEPPRNGTLINSGTLSGTVQFNNLASASVTNSGAIASLSGNGIFTTAPGGTLSIDNQATGSITGATSGIRSEGSGLSVTNAGTIRGNGTTFTLRAADAGILILGGPAAITNSGNISGAGFGITTGSYSDPDTNAASGRAIGSTIDNSGSIIGDSNDGVRLIGGGTVTNSGYIAGRVGAGADGVSMFAFEDQDTTAMPQIGTVNNLAGGIIEGNRLGVILSGGGTVNNAGTINGGVNGAVLIQTGFIGGKTGSITNNGTINGAVGFVDLAGASVTNTGSINGGLGYNGSGAAALTNSGIIASTSGDAVYSEGSLTLTNNAGATINANTPGYAIDAHGPSTIVTNAGTINGDVQVVGTSASASNSGTINGSIQFTSGSATLTNSGTINANSLTFRLISGLTSLTNSGTINGINGGPGVEMTAGNDVVTLLTGSAINAVVDGLGGSDTLRLSGTIAAPTSSQTVGQFLNFDTLNVLGGYWTAPGNTGTFSSTAINGGALAVNGTITSPITVNAGGMLAGTGRITGATTLNSGGLLAPGGSSIGTLSIVGNVAFNTGSTFSVQTNPSGASDKLAVTGGVTITKGTTLQILAGIFGNYAPVTSYVVMTASGGISGKFDSVTTDYAYFKATVNTQQKGTITVQIAPNGKPLPSAAAATTFGTAAAVESLGTGSPLYQSVLYQSLSGAREAFSSLSGSSYGRRDALMADDVGNLRLGLDASDSPAPKIEWTGVNSLGSRGVSSGSVTRHGSVSLMIVGGRYGARFSDNSAVADVDTRFFGTGAGYRSGRFQILAGVLSAWHDIAAARTISFPGFNDHTSSHYMAESHRIDVESTYALSRGRVAIAPYAGYSLLLTRSQAFGESGGFSALTFAPATTSVDQLRIGVRMQGKLNLGRFAIVPHLDASIEGSWGDLQGSKIAHFAGSNDFDSRGAAFNRRSAKLDAGISVKAGRMTLSGSYRGRIGDSWNDHSGLLEAALRF